MASSISSHLPKIDHNLKMSHYLEKGESRLRRNSQGEACRRSSGNTQLVGQLWSQSPSERGVVEPYSSLFLSNRVNRHDLNLALGRVHVRLYLYVTPLDPA